MYVIYRAALYVQHDLTESTCGESTSCEHLVDDEHNTAVRLRSKRVLVVR